MKKTSFFNKLVSFGVCYTLLVYTTPTKAGNVVGDFYSQSQNYLKFAFSFNKNSIGYLLFFNKKTKQYQACSGTLIKSGKDIDPTTKQEYVGGWVLTSAHCSIDPKDALGGKFVTEKGEADIDAFIRHIKYNPAIPYAEQIIKVDGEDKFMCVASDKPCGNKPQVAIMDIALVHINKDLTATGLEPIAPAKGVNVPSAGFVGGFVGYGKQGGADPEKPGKTKQSADSLSTLDTSDPKKESSRLLAAENDKLGGKNFFNVLKYSATDMFPYSGQVFYADLDNGSGSYNVDNKSDTQLNLEYSPYFGDSGAGVFDENNNLVAIVSGAGYGNKVSSNTIKSFAPPHYGSLTFYTPLAQHRGWISSVIKANKFKKFTSKPYEPTGENYSPFMPSTGALSSTSKSLPDSMINIIADVIIEPYPETFDDAVWEEVFPSNPNS
jgi:hypothetical protein